MSASHTLIETKSSTPEYVTLPITYEFIAHLLSAWDEKQYGGYVTDRILTLEKQTKLKTQMKDMKLFTDEKEEFSGDETFKKNKITLLKDFRRGVTYEFDGISKRAEDLYIDLMKKNPLPAGFSEDEIFLLFIINHYLGDEATQDGLSKAVMNINIFFGSYYALGVEPLVSTIRISHSKEGNLTIQWEFTCPLKVLTGNSLGEDIYYNMEVKHESHIIKNTNNGSYTFIPNEKNSFVKISIEAWHKIIEKSYAWLTELIKTKNSDLLKDQFKLGAIYMLLPVLQDRSFRKKFIEDFYLKQPKETQTQIDEMIDKCLPESLVNSFKKSLPISKGTALAGVLSFSGFTGGLMYAGFIGAIPGAAGGPVGLALGALTGIVTWSVCFFLTAAVYHLGSFVWRGIKSLFKSDKTPKKDEDEPEEKFSQSRYFRTSSHTSSFIKTVSSPKTTNSQKTTPPTADHMPISPTSDPDKILSPSRRSRNGF